MKHGSQKKISEGLGIGFRSIQSYLSGHQRPMPARAFELQEKHGIPAATLLIGTKEEVAEAFNAWLAKHEKKTMRKKTVCEKCGR